MKTVLDPSDWASMLDRYRGATAQLWMFQVSLKRFLIRLSLPDAQQALYITAVGCEHIVAQFSWQNASIVIMEVQANKKTVITDQTAGFELVCHGAALALAPADEALEDFWGKSDQRAE